jgi:carbonic anhydrase/acetyltransferase-like protein (isoleucine patch superfamily)
MYAVIHEIDSSFSHGLIPIAGRPLVARQIQWLRSVRCKGIAVQIGSSAESVALGQWLARRDPIGTNVRLVMSSKVLSPKEIARRAGFPDHTRLLAIPADVLCGGDIDAISAHASPEGTLVALPAPPPLADELDGSAVRMLGPTRMRTSTTGNAWAIRVRSLADAFSIGVAVLEGRLSRRSENGVLLHASERERGVWTSRGAYIDPSAKIIPPVLLGVDTIIRAGASVGPRVFLGDRSVVERGTRMEDSMIAAGTIVGEDLAFCGIAIDSRGTQDLFTGEHATIDETLLLAPRDKPHQGNLLGRCLAAMLLALLAPICLLLYIKAAADARRKQSNGLRHPSSTLSSVLMQTVRGERTFIGLSDWTDDLPIGASPALYWKSMAAPLGFIRIDAGLVPDDADAGTRLRARVYYMHEKSFLLDLVLVFRCLGRMIARHSNEPDKSCQADAPAYMKALS